MPTKNLASTKSLPFKHTVSCNHNSIFSYILKHLNVNCRNLSYSNLRFTNKFYVTLMYKYLLTVNNLILFKSNEDFNALSSEVSKYLKKDAQRNLKIQI